VRPVKRLDLPGVALPASNIVLGLMRISSLGPGEIRELVGTALEEGINFFDHAGVYGMATHECESLFATALGWSSAEREKAIIQTKAGIIPGGYDSSREHILDSVDQSLAALRTDYIDILLIHRPDVLVEPDEVAAAFETLQASGKVRNFGVSNHTPAQIELLGRSVRQPLLVNQVRLSLVHSPLITTGTAASDEWSNQSVAGEGGLLDYSRLHDMTLQAWSPFQKKGFDGVFVGDREAYPELNLVLDELAETYDVTPTGIAVAWITRIPADIQVVLGTTNPERVRQSAAGSDIPLTRAEWYRLYHAAGYLAP
jgi:predicted oxidoreductase